MHLRPHANATTTPKQRAYLQASTRPVAELAGEAGASETTVRRCKLKEYHHNKPALFQKRPINHPGPDS